MRLISITRCQPGMVLAKPIYTDTGTVLLNRDVSLTDSMIQRLKQKGINTLYIRDKATEDIEVNEVISEETRRSAMKTIHQSFTDIILSEQKWKTRLSMQAVTSFRTMFESILYDLKKNRNAMNLLTNIYTHDNYVYAHSLNVAIYSAALAIQQGYNDKELTEIGIGALFHDIGKLMLPEEILNKPDRLTEDEFEIIKKHAEYGFEFLRNQDGISLLSAHCAYQHHERMNGSGYPRGLKGDEIHRFARVMAVCDVFDALTTNRVYRKAMLPHEAVEILYTGAGDGQFESKLVEGFRDTIAIYPLGITVVLNTGEVGVVVDYNRRLPSRPIVRITKHPDGRDVDKYYEIDLSKELTIMIVGCDAII
ncbi:HD-GYP domain-containing protein [Aneurinibacillus tyrosinisolvens]|uniref:HD-GYP domain-containing protein n=1 Tax=Aneurinibacillus tyrosinisolvens TaxID=1443435 RepID=UPI00063F9780|nr:HD-GYP domain-containing protein [Aneurinibacillus tyrosinisolvens]